MDLQEAISLLADMWLSAHERGEYASEDVILAELLRVIDLYATRGEAEEMAVILDAVTGALYRVVDES